MSATAFQRLRRERAARAAQEEAARSRVAPREAQEQPAEAKGKGKRRKAQRRS